MSLLGTLWVVKFPMISIRTAKALVRLCGYAYWSESSPGGHSRCQGALLCKQNACNISQSKSNDYGKTIFEPSIRPWLFLFICNQCTYGHLKNVLTNMNCAPFSHRMAQIPLLLKSHAFLLLHMIMPIIAIIILIEYNDMPIKQFLLN